MYVKIKISLYLFSSKHITHFSSHTDSLETNLLKLVESILFQDIREKHLIQI